ncbi:MAG: xylulokinase [Acidimicrobiales bacterium]
MADPVTVGVDIGTTSVKALAVDGDGHVVATARVPHKISTPAADMLEHDARRAWRAGPRRAYSAVTADLSAPVAGVSVASMVPSLTAVDRRGVPVIPGLLYGDVRGRPEDGDEPAETPAFSGAMPDAEGFLRWAVAEAPGAAGYWPCQAVATFALSGVAAVDSAMVASLGGLHAKGEWNTSLLDKFGVDPSQLPVVVPMCEAGGTLPGTDTVFTGGTIDALCDQVVAGATEPGDVLAIFGATLVIWVVTDRWVEVPDLISVPHTVAGRFLMGGPSNAGALFVDWARRLLRGLPLPGPATRPAEVRPGDPQRVPVWLPYLRGERTPYNNPMLRASVHGLDITQGPGAIGRGAYEASGFVIRRMLERAGVEGRRIVASGGGTRVEAWMAGVADATGLPVDTVAVPEGAAFGAAFFARLAAGLERSLDDSARWARVGRRVEPDPAWARAAAVRYRLFEELGPGT